MERVRLKEDGSFYNSLNGKTLYVKNNKGGGKVVVGFKNIKVKNGRSKQSY